MDRASKLPKLQDEERESQYGYVYAVSGPGKLLIIVSFDVGLTLQWKVAILENFPNSSALFLVGFPHSGSSNKFPISVVVMSYLFDLDFICKFLLSCSLLAATVTVCYSLTTKGVVFMVG